jgi:hypothetical protein
MSYTLEAPTYKGSTPYDFTITGVTLDEETFENADNFVIDAETGVITIQNTASMSTGLYSISVGCYSNGVFYNFKDAVQVNMLLAVPDGVTVEPAEVLVNQDEENWADASAQVTTEKDKHVSITGYAIAQDESKPYLAYFNIDGEGKITINPETKDKLIAGENYTLSLKLTTRAGEHMYTDAVTFKVVSKPRSLVYKRKQDIYEVNVAGQSGVPTYEGGKDGLTFTIKSVTPETTAFSIDAATGEISLPEGHSLTASDTPYVFTITASNTYGSTDFEDVYAVTISNYVTPIDVTTFHYTTIDKLYQKGGSATCSKDEGFIGDAVTFSFATDLNSEEINKAINNNIIELSKDGQGTVSIANTHTLSIGEHQIHIRATNMKNEETGGVTASLNVNVVKNPNDFTYVSWGTNIEDEMVFDNTTYDYHPKKETDSNYRNQFRFINKNVGTSSDLVSQITVLDSDIPNGANVSYKLVGKFPDNNNFPSLAINNTLVNGDIAITKNDLGDDYRGAILLIEVTSSNNEAPAVKKNIPIFFNVSRNQTFVLLFTPFVVKINPRTGVCSSTECKVVTWKNHRFSADNTTNTLVVDYRRDFSYWNFDNNINHGSGTLGDASPSTHMLCQVWNNCGMKSLGSRAPMSYYKAEANWEVDTQNTKAGYINAANNKQLWIDPSKWIGTDGLYPNGVVIGDIRYDFEGKVENIHASDGSAKGYYPLYLWFDESYEGN